MNKINYALPETGFVELKFEIRVSAEEARKTVDRWLFNEVTMQMRALEPELVVDRTILWRVPVSFGVITHGQLGQVGHVDVDVSSGMFNVNEKAKADLISEARRLASALPPFRPIEVPSQYLSPSIEE